MPEPQHCIAQEQSGEAEEGQDLAVKWGSCQRQPWAPPWPKAGRPSNLLPQDSHVVCTPWQGMAEARSVLFWGLHVTSSDGGLVFPSHLGLSESGASFGNRLDTCTPMFIAALFIFAGGLGLHLGLPWPQA